MRNFVSIFSEFCRVMFYSHEPVIGTFVFSETVSVSRETSQVRPFKHKGPAAAVFATLIALSLLAAGFATPASGFSHGAPIVRTHDGLVRGVAESGGYVFRGLPYATPPTGELRWKAPQPPASWDGVRDATKFAPNCPQPAGFTVGPMKEDCL